MRDVVRSYRDLGVWNESMDLAVDCCSATSGFPAREVYGLTSLIRRASMSIPVDLAKGYGRDSLGHCMSFLPLAQGSLKELETHGAFQRVGFRQRGRGGAGPVESGWDGKNAEVSHSLDSSGEGMKHVARPPIAHCRLPFSPGIR